MWMNGWERKGETNLTAQYLDQVKQSGVDKVSKAGKETSALLESPDHIVNL
jgi:hypothetical protein